MQCTCHYSSPVIVSNCFLYLPLLPPLRILIHDVQELVDQSTPKDTSSHKQIPENYSYTQYHPMEEVKKKLYQFVLFVAILYIQGNKLCACRDYSTGFTKALSGFKGLFWRISTNFGTLSRILAWLNWSCISHWFWSIPQFLPGQHLNALLEAAILFCQQYSGIQLISFLCFYLIMPYHNLQYLFIEVLVYLVLNQM